jgi:mono/diheme cytochrome c family protein
MLRYDVAPTPPVSLNVRKALLPALVVLLVLGALLPWLLPATMRWRADNAVWRGMRIASESGCFACHAAPHGQEVANPGSPFGTVPSFAGANLRMYVERPAEVQEWIREGHTEKLEKDPEAWAVYRAQTIRMPPFEERLNAGEVTALAAYVLAADGYRTPTGEQEIRGEEIARTHCLGCHNVAGAGGLPNPGSTFGYIPGWWGSDFGDLVRDDEELREWIRTGSSQRVAKWPLTRWFWRRQAIRMPAYEGRLPAADIEALVAYVRWLGTTDFADFTREGSQ